MKHGIPQRGEFLTWSSWERDPDKCLLHQGWRREHAHRVWQAMQAVVAVVSIYSADGDGDGCLTERELCAYEARWLWNGNPYFPK